MQWTQDFIDQIYKYLNDRDDSGIDRLNRLYTVALLSAFVTLISTQQYIVGSKILCWTPKDFSGQHETYAHDICWLGQTNYYLSENTTTLNSPSDVREYPFLIYPWLPIVLLAMTAFFLVPYVFIWRFLTRKLGFNINRLMKINDENTLCSAIDFLLQKKYVKKQRQYFSILHVYLLMKFLYICNLCLQILFIHKLLLGYYLPFNFSNISNILSFRYNMWSSAHLPIETMCDFMVRMLGQNNNWFTIQCILPYNLFTKRIFALLFFWFIILLILNICSFAMAFNLRNTSIRFQYIKSLFNLYRNYLYHDQRVVIDFNALTDQQQTDFTFEYLGINGYLLLEFLHTRLSNLDMSCLVVKLLHRYSGINHEETDHENRTDM